jgi:hypothetical protein
VSARETRATKRSTLLLSKVTPSDAEAIRDAAKRRGLTVSTYLRDAALASRRPVDTKAT